ncbi:MAG: polysaccharide deacetylase family protein [Bacteroidota bacterium]
MLVYTPHITARVRYIVETILPGAVVIDSKEVFVAKDAVRINYSNEPIAGAFQIIPSGLLMEKDIHSQKIQCGEWEGLYVFFQTGGDLPFDVFAASFYLLSRYEEYLPHELDEYGRYSHTNSIAYKEGFLKQPLVNEWVQSLAKKLQVFFPHARFTIHASGFSFIPTYDIDEAFSYRHKPVWKNVLGFYRDLLQGRFEQVMERGNVYSGKKKDPYDTFNWMDDLHDRYQLQPVYFLLTILKRGEYDKNLPARSKVLQQLYQHISKKYTVGLHPSWQSGTDEWLLEKEIQALQSITGKPITLSRNHYLRFSVPDTYRRLINAAITDDYSMAYGGVNGFRASYALPFKWYDLEKETSTGLTIHPFCFMEATSFFNQGHSAAEAGEELQYYYDAVKKVNGECMVLFHNHFLTEQQQWLPWREMYADFLEKNFG